MKFNSNFAVLSGLLSQLECLFVFPVWCLTSCNFKLRVLLSDPVVVIDFYLTQNRCEANRPRVSLIQVNRIWCCFRVNSILKSDSLKVYCHGFIDPTILHMLKNFSYPKKRLYYVLSLEATYYWYFKTTNSANCNDISLFKQVFYR